MAILLLAPFLGESLSTATPPFVLLLPWKLALLAALYGCGALLCREVAVRCGFGLPGLCLLAAAYGVYEEALIGHSWFDATYQADVGLDAYSRVWHTNLVLATHLTAFHVAVSVCASVLLVERLFPERRDEPWLGRRGQVLAALALFVVVPLTYGTLGQGPLGPQLAAALLVVLLVVAAFEVPRRTAPRGEPRRIAHPRLVGLVAFAATGAQFVLTYAVASTGLPWPAGLALSLLPVVVGVLVVARQVHAGDDGLPVVVGILGFFVVLGAVVGLGGRYDLVLGAVATAAALWWLSRRARLAGQPAPAPGARA